MSPQISCKQSETGNHNLMSIWLYGTDGYPELHWLVAIKVADHRDVKGWKEVIRVFFIK